MSCILSVFKDKNRGLEWADQSDSTLYRYEPASFVEIELNFGESCWDQPR